MSGPTDGLPDDDVTEDARRAARAEKTDRRAGADPPSGDAAKTEDEKAKTEIEAGDVADDLADFA